MSFAAVLIVIGRVLFGLFFLIAGVRNALHFNERLTLKTNYGWPLPMPLLAAGFALQGIGGLAPIFGIFTDVAAWLLILFLAAATPLFHNLFMFRGKERAPHLYSTLVNITLAGGLLLIIATSGGIVSAG
jgi:putative oxidoreductase